MLKLNKKIKRKGFTLAELVTAVAILAMLAGFISVIFKSSIDGYRSAGANTEIMQNLRAITEQLNTDFEGLCKDGYLIIQKEAHSKRRVYENNPETEDVFMDRIYYFTTGDFQSWENASVKSNIARIFWGHDSNSLNPNNNDPPLSKCKLARDIVLLTPGVVPAELPEDCRSVSFAQIKNEPNVAYLLKLIDPNEQDILTDSITMDIQSLEDVGRLLCESIGEFKIEWTEGNIDSEGLLVWDSNEVAWRPNGQKPKALRFTFTLYDSRGILQDGRRFTHIVYLDN